MFYFYSNEFFILYPLSVLYSLFMVFSVGCLLMTCCILNSFMNVKSVIVCVISRRYWTQCGPLNLTEILLNIPLLYSLSVSSTEVNELSLKPWATSSNITAAWLNYLWPLDFIHDNINCLWLFSKLEYSLVLSGVFILTIVFNNCFRFQLFRYKIFCF